MSELLQTFSDSLANLVKQTAPYIVRVEGRRRVPSSGVVLGEGLIATAHHALRADKAIPIGLDSGESAVADLVGRDPSLDLAILRTNATLTPFPITQGENKVGHLALALGRPGQQVQATLGIISALHDNWRTPLGGAVEQYIQTDVVMYPGFSGGPLINMAGEMIGLNTSGLVRGLSLTLPASAVTRTAQTLAQHGRIRRGYLGVSTQPASLPRNLSHQLQQRAGLLVVAVEPDSPADQAGLVLGDTLVAAANQAVQSHEDLLALLTGETVGRKVPFSIVRGGQLQSVDIIVGERA